MSCFKVRIKRIAPPNILNAIGLSKAQIKVAIDVGYCEVLHSFIVHFRGSGPRGPVGPRWSTAVLGDPQTNGTDN
jgi:hypothetical protein